VSETSSRALLIDIDGVVLKDDQALPGASALVAAERGQLDFAPLLGRLVAAMATGAPWPLEQDLVDAIDPGRWLVRAARSRPSRSADRG